MVHIALPFGLTVDPGTAILNLVMTYLGLALPVDVGLTTALDLSPIFDTTLDSSWLFDTWNRLVLLYAQSF